MRTDCKIDSERRLNLPQIATFSPGRTNTAGRGDIVYWRCKSDPLFIAQTEYHFVDRVIGVVTAHDLNYPHLCVAMMLGDTACERWVDPAWVWDCTPIRYPEKLPWLFGPQFLNTPPDMARQCFEKLTPRADLYPGVT